MEKNFIEKAEKEIGRKLGCKNYDYDNTRMV